MGRIYRMASDLPAILLFNNPISPLATCHKVAYQRSCQNAIIVAAHLPLSHYLAASVTVRFCR